MKKMKRNLYCLHFRVVIITLIFLLPFNTKYIFSGSHNFFTPYQQNQIPDEAFKNLEKKLQDALYVNPKGQTSYNKFYLSQDELNAYIQVNYAHRFPLEIKAWQIRLDGEEATILVLISLDEFRETIEEELHPTARILLSGEITLRVWGYFDGSDGMGKFDIKGLRLGFLPIPVSLVKQMIISKSSEEDAEVLDKGFPLPEGFESAEIANSLVIINHNTKTEQ